MELAWVQTVSDPGYLNQKKLMLIGCSRRSGTTVCFKIFSLACSNTAKALLDSFLQLATARNCSFSGLDGTRLTVSTS